MDTASGDFDSPKEFCGLCGVYGVSDVGPTLYQGLFSLQHRGRRAPGLQRRMAAGPFGSGSGTRE
jgi:hypothetical protein